MANELKHGSVGTELTQAEWEGIGTHVVANQAVGDIVYADTTAQLLRLGIGSTNDVLRVTSGKPDWQATTFITGLGTVTTGVWQGTDVGVAYGGTGVSTLTANGVLIGNGTSAIGAVDMSTKGHLLIGDGSGNPQMLGVGTNTHVMTADSGETTGVKWAAPAAAAAGSLTGSTLASGVTASSLTSVGTIATGVWQGTDVGVAYGGTGVSTLTSNAVLTGNGASAITAEGNLTFDGSTLTVDGDLTFTGSQSISTSSGNLSLNAAAGSAIRLNDSQANVDVVIESDAADNLFHADAGTGTIGLLRSASGSSGVIIGGSITGANGFDAAGLAVLTAVTPDPSDIGFVVNIEGTVIEAASGTHTDMGQLRVKGNAVTTAGGGTTTDASTVWIAAPMSGATNNYALVVDAGVSRFDGDIDLNSTGTLLNVGASGNDWTAANLLHAAPTSGEQTIRCQNTNDASGYGARVQVKVAGSSSGDGFFEWIEGSNHTFRMGIDVSASLLVLTRGTALGTDDVFRVTDASPPVMSYNATHPTGTFDYVCGTCGRHEAEIFTCCGLVEWHDDVEDYRAMALREPGALDYMERVGVIERTVNNEGDPEVFTVLGRDFEFSMSAVFQNRQRMDAQNEATNERLARIEAAIGV